MYISNGVRIVAVYFLNLLIMLSMQDGKLYKAFYYFKVLNILKMLENIIKNIKRRAFPILATTLIGCGLGEGYYDKVIVNLVVCYRWYDCPEKLPIDVYVDNIKYADSSNIEFVDKFNNDKMESKDHKIKVKYNPSYAEEYLTLNINNASPRFDETIWLCNEFNGPMMLCYNECKEKIGYYDCLKEPDGK